MKINPIGILTETFGWAYAFYVPSVITAVITFAWFSLVFDSPAEHPRIEKVEQEYIESSLGGNISKKKVRFLKIPYYYKLFVEWLKWSKLVKKLHFHSFFRTYSTSAHAYFQILKFDHFISFSSFYWTHFTGIATILQPHNIGPFYRWVDKK